MTLREFLEFTFKDAYHFFGVLVLSTAPIYAVAAVVGAATGCH